MVFGAVMLAAAIAFGLGGRHLARRLLEEKPSRTQQNRPADELEPPHL